VLLGDDLDAWPHHPQDRHLLRMWTRLRVHFIGAVWMTRCQRPTNSSFAKTVASLCIQSLTTALRRDWTRVTKDLRTLDNGSFCAGWWRGFDRELPMEAFEEQWPQFFHHFQDPVLPETSKTLSLLLSETLPVLIPL
jgi:hypothetical protein